MGIPFFEKKHGFVLKKRNVEHFGGVKNAPTVWRPFYFVSQCFAFKKGQGNQPYFLTMTSSVLRTGLTRAKEFVRTQKLQLKQFFQR